MFYLKCSSKIIARAKLKKESLAVAGSTPATLGNWCMTMLRVDGTNVVIYMSERSLLSFMLTAIADYYRHLIEVAGGLHRCNIGSIVHHVNSTPRKPIGYSFPVGAARELVSGGAAS